MSENLDLVKAPEESLHRQEKFQVSIPQWTGPYDLLLKVIDEQELNLLDLNISVLLEHYLQHLQNLDTIDLDEAGEFLVMAATLAQIKSKLLLPKEETEDEEEEEDPRAELVRNLVEYQKIKQAADFLREQPVLGRDVFTKGLRESFQGLEGEGRGTLFQLVKGFQKAIQRVQAQEPFEVEQEHINVSQRFHEIFESLREKSELQFESLLQEGQGKVFLIATFLATLELVRMKKIEILQREVGGPVFLVFKEGATEADVVHSEFDEEAL